LEAADFVNKLIQRKPINRLGLDGPTEVKNHPWLKNFPWQKLLNKELDPPFMPPEDSFDPKNQNLNGDWGDENTEVLKQNAILLRRNSVQGLFDGYNFDMTTAVKSEGLSPLPGSSLTSNFNNSIINQSTQSFTGSMLENNR